MELREFSGEKFKKNWTFFFFLKKELVLLRRSGCDSPFSFSPKKGKSYFLLHIQREYNNIFFFFYGRDKFTRKETPKRKGNIKKEKKNHDKHPVWRIWRRRVGRRESSDWYMRFSHIRWFKKMSWVGKPTIIVALTRRRRLMLSHQKRRVKTSWANILWMGDVCAPFVMFSSSVSEEFSCRKNQKVFVSSLSRSLIADHLKCQTQFRQSYNQNLYLQYVLSPNVVTYYGTAKESGDKRKKASISHVRSVAH